MNQNVKKCSKLLRELKYDAILISNPANIKYLTKFSGGGYLLVTSGQTAVYFTNFIYKEAAKKIPSWELVISGKNIFFDITNKIKKLKVKKVAFEAKGLSFKDYRALKTLLSKTGTELVETDNIVERLRMIKSGNEICLIKKAIEVSKEALEFIAEIFDEKMTEKDICINIDRFLRLKGDNETAFATIVAAGQNTVFPHHLPQEEKIGKKPILIDLGAKHYGYCADLTRVIFWSKMPNIFKQIYETVKKAQELSIKKVKEGVTAEEIDKAARDFITKKGWGRYFGHGTGHGIGLAVHEPPFLRQNNKEILREGMVITIEPAIYLGKKFGVRIEDMVLVKQNRGEVLSGNIDR